MDEKNKFVFDDRKKELKHTINEEMPLFGKEEYGKVLKKTEVISNEYGTVRVLKYLDNQAIGLRKEIDRVEAELKGKQEALEGVEKEMREVKELIGTRINFKKIEKELEKQDKEAQTKKEAPKETPNK